MVALIALLACVRLDDAWSIVIKDYSTWQLNCIAICFCIRAAAVLLSKVISLRNQNN
jgi:hypothetical protein